jgi:tetratricopeptide (TPR) repeat protein
LFEGLEGTQELATELGLFNRVGDLYLKLSKVPEAVDMYERAANLYAEYGFPNNAIALCNKVLRNAPGRTHVYLRLAQLMVERGFVPQAKENLLEYADRMQKAGKTDEAFRALKEFADLSPDNEEIRLLLAEQLKGAARTAEAREQLAKLFAETQAKGDERRSRATLQNIKAIDPDFDPAKAPKPKIKERPQKSSDLIFLDVDEEYRTEAPPPPPKRRPTAPPRTAAPAVADLPLVTPLEEPREKVGEEALLIEGSTIEGAEEPATEVGRLDGLDIQREFEGAPPVEGLEIERTSLADDEEEGAAAVQAQLDELLEEGLDLPEIELEEAPPAGVELPEIEVEVPEPAGVGAAAEEYRAPDIPALEARVADDPDDAGRHVALGEALLEAGKRERGLEELDIALGLFEAAEHWNDVQRVVDEILRLEPNSVRHHQKRVERAFRTGEKRDMVEAYLGLANALVRTGGTERAEMVFKRVLEYDPSNASALEALASLVPEEPEAPQPVAAGAPAGGYVDLGALIFDEEVERDSRMRVQDEEPTGDEERDFADMLSQFKRGIEANIEEEDWQAHYDLGVAFKEMGLLDEAIAEFQKALRAPAGRLRTAEALGACFYQKKQFSVAATVMRRAVETDPSPDDAKIALLYWLGRCDEELNRRNEALTWFQRVFALDIQFADVAKRVEHLSAG